MPITDAMPELNRTLQFFPVENENPSTLTHAQIEQFNEKGFISPLDVFSEAEMAEHRAYFDQLMEKALAAGMNSYSINGWHTTCPGIHDLITEGRILDYVQDLLGETLICWGTHYFCKLPGDVKQVSWHQDASYWPLSPSKTVTVWLAIDDAAVENGAMTVIPKSHLHGQIAFEPSTAEEKNVLGQTVHGATQYGDAPFPFEMKAGQMSLHSDLLLHGSEPNTSDRRRCGLTMRFVPPEVHAANDWNRRAIVARGNDPSGHWVHNPRPAEDSIPER
ncbi:phytanoyl-CoA dioxygenase family protein [Candidatus Poribacteria bacterium]|nr:phytanoyl-CoA dioxygenase family protein [Candidatus Poribacteria bacterium]